MSDDVNEYEDFMDIVSRYYDTSPFSQLASLTREERKRLGVSDMVNDFVDTTLNMLDDMGDVTSFRA